VPVFVTLDVADDATDVVAELDPEVLPVEEADAEADDVTELLPVLDAVLVAVVLGDDNVQSPNPLPM